MSNRRKETGRIEGGTFAPFPSAVLNSDKFRTLSAYASRLLLDLASQYNGHNNGDLAAPWSQMTERRWNSKATLQKAIREAIGAGMIEQTRQGGRRECTLFAFTWIPIHESKKRRDVGPTKVQSGLWKKGSTLET